MDYAMIKSLVNMTKLLESYGIETDSNGRCACPLHGGGNKTAFSVSNDKQTWKCHTKCDGGGDIFTFIEKKEGCSNTEARTKLMEMFGLTEDAPPAPAKKAVKVKPVEVSRESYIYRDKAGKELYRVNRVDFADGSKQCYQECNGKRTLPPEIRTLYNLDMIHGCTDLIYLCEGEKTADALTQCELVATTNPLGSKNWNDSYASLLQGMSVVVMPDADEHGEVWRDKVMKSLEGVAHQVQVVSIPDRFIKKHPEYTGHDYADMAKEYGDSKCMEWLSGQVATAKILQNGVDRAILGIPSDGFKEMKRKADAGITSDVFNLNEWLPSLDLVVNKGDLVTIMAGTGVGKTRALHNIPYYISSINCAMFDLELSFETLVERYTAMHNGISVRNVKERMARGFGLEEPNLTNVFIQKMTGLTVTKIKERVDMIEQITQQKIHAVGLDYVGLMAGKGSAYEKTSDNVEEFKAFISDTDRVGLMSTQVSRPADKETGMFECPSPFSAKNSGSIENSSQILLGVWRPTTDGRVMKCRCLKYSHGESPSHDINLIADDLRITEVNYG